MKIPRPIDERFADWVDGRLTAEQLARLQADLAADPELRAAAERYRATVQMVRAGLATERVPVSFADAVLARLDAPPARRPFLLPFLASSAAAAAIVLLFLVLRHVEPSRDLTARRTARGGDAPADDARGARAPADQLAKEAPSSAAEPERKAGQDAYRRGGAGGAASNAKGSDIKVAKGGDAPDRVPVRGISLLPVGGEQPVRSEQDAAKRPGEAAKQSGEEAGQGGAALEKQQEQQVTQQQATQQQATQQQATQQQATQQQIRPETQHEGKPDGHAFADLGTMVAVVHAAPTQQSELLEQLGARPGPSSKDALDRSAVDKNVTGGKAIDQEARDRDDGDRQASKKDKAGKRDSADEEARKLVAGRLAWTSNTLPPRIEQLAAQVGAQGAASGAPDPGAPAAGAPTAAAPSTRVPVQETPAQDSPVQDSKVTGDQAGGAEREKLRRLRESAVDDLEQLQNELQNKERSADLGAAGQIRPDAAAVQGSLFQPKPGDRWFKVTGDAEQIRSFMLMMNAQSAQQHLAVEWQRAPASSAQGYQGLLAPAVPLSALRDETLSRDGAQAKTRPEAQTELDAGTGKAQAPANKPSTRIGTEQAASPAPAEKSDEDLAKRSFQLGQPQQRLQLGQSRPQLGQQRQQADTLTLLMVLRDVTPGATIR